MLVLFIAGLYFLLFHVLNLQPARNVACCGLFGFSGKQPVDLAKIRWLALLNESRGRHSTGIHAIKGNKNKDMVLYKDNVDATKFIMDDKTVEAMRGAVSLQGHTRLATQGAQTVTNSHPFEYKLGTHVVGCHNGYIADELQKRFVKEYGLQDVFPKGEPDVDSMLLFAVLSKTNGNYKELSNIEGGVVTLFHIPEKYGDALFAYKRAARDLHYGLAPEGIYISSEEQPLKMIGCTITAPVDDDTITIFKDGQVIDVIPMGKPLVHVPWNGGRASFTNVLTAAAKEKYPELVESDLARKTTNYSGYNTELPFNDTGKHWKKSKKHTPAKVYSTTVTPTTEENYEDRMCLIMKETLEEIEALAPANFRLIAATASDTVDYPIDELMDSLVLIQLFGDGSKKEPLPAWTIYDIAETEVSTITGVNGIGILRYKGGDGTERKLRLYDPIEGGNVFELSITPKMGRVLEVALAIPFQEADEKGAKGRKTETTNPSKKGTGDTTIHDLGRFVENTVLSTFDEPKLLVANKENVSGSLSGEGSEVSGGSEGQENAGTEKQGTNEREDAGGSPAVYGKRNRAFLAKDVNSINSLVRAKQLKVKLGEIPEVDKIRASAEYKKVYNGFFYYLTNVIDVQKLMEDASTLKYHDKAFKGDCRSVLYYAILLMDYSITPAGLKKITHGMAPEIMDLPYKYLKTIHIAKVKETIALVKDMMTFFETEADAFDIGEFFKPIKNNTVEVGNEGKPMMELRRDTRGILRYSPDFNQMD